MSDSLRDSLHNQLAAGDEALASRFRGGENVTILVRDRACFVDEIITTAWQHCCETPDNMTLVAVGGYGRAELHPHSDIDILILAEAAGLQDHEQAIQRFLALLWDIGLNIGHSVRTVEECVTTATADITVATNLMEARYLAGSEPLYESMNAAIAPDRIWSPSNFLEAKWQEQDERHAKYGHTAYELEPNIKDGPGGLRDIQTIIWLAQRYFGTADLQGLVDHDFLTEDECRELTEDRDFLWRVRFALHLTAGRREDRLLFDHQLRIAEQFGFKDNDRWLGVEQFMQHYYRTLMSSSQLNEMLLQLFQEALLLDANAPAQMVDEYFQIRNRFLETRSEHTFHKEPHNLLRLFLILEQHPELNGVSAHTIRLIRRDLDLIDDAFRADPANRICFMTILHEPGYLNRTLKKMNHYGVLGRYVPAFGRIVGRMQYDLFHVYTVDEHILTVVANLHRFTRARHDHEFPICSRIMQTLKKPEIAYLGGLFHDIAKGRGGDHSTLGALDAEQFCLDHSLSRYDARLVSWLVKNHLSLSMTAQKRDINDPTVINEFASLIGDRIHLDLLYVLTVADLRATNPSLWNSWKASLFGELYANTQRALRQGLENPIDRDELINETRDSARALLLPRLDDPHIDAVWETLTDDYFLQHTADEIAWHTEALAQRESVEPVTILMRTDSGRGGTAISIVYADRDEPTFGRATAVLDQLGLTIVDARIVPVGEHASFDTYVVLEDTGEAIDDSRRIEEIAAILKREIGQSGSKPMTVTRRAPRQVRMFSTPTTIEFSVDARNHRTIMEINTGDRPGLLSRIGRVLRDEGIHLQNAKITTVGEKAEDVFFVTLNGRELDKTGEQRLREKLLDSIDSSSEA